MNASVTLKYVPTMYQITEILSQFYQTYLLKSLACFDEHFYSFL